MAITIPLYQNSTFDNAYLVEEVNRLDILKKVGDTHAFRSKVVRLTPISTSIYGCPRLAIGNERFKKEIEEMLNIKFNRERMGRPKKEKCL